MSIVSDAISEIRDFVEKFTADSFFKHPQNIAKFGTAYKHLHSLLIWSLLIERGEFPEAQFGAHPKEGISDLAHAFGLTTFSLYKPARMMARSGIENIVRTIVAEKNGDYKVKSIHSLFDNANDVLRDSSNSQNLIQNLRNLYGDLCLTVHSAHEDHLALRARPQK